MKRLSTERRAYEIRRAIKGLRRRSRKKYVLLTSGGMPSKFTSDQIRRAKLITIRSARGDESARVVEPARPVPAILSLNRNFEETSKFIFNVRESLADGCADEYMPKSNQHLKAIERSHKNLKTYFDFSMIEEISASVALILAAEYDCYRRVGGFVPGAVDMHLWKPEVRAILEGIGFLDMAGVRKQGPTYLEGSDWKILRFKSGSEADGEQVGNLLSELGVDAALDNPELYGAILEALVNTRHHAYPKDVAFSAPFFPGWWLTGFVDHGSRRLRISVYDRGLSIPGTLQTWDKYSLFQRAWRRVFSILPDPDDVSRDGSAIALAMEVGRSSTGEGYRGKGLPSMEDALDLCVEGAITIYSRTGEYRRLKGQKPHYVNRNASIGGTLVTWDLRF